VEKKNSKLIFVNWEGFVLIVGLILTFNLLPCVYVQSESWDCPVSAKRKVNPNTMMISDRRRTLRSCRRLIEETGTASLPRSSRESSSSPDDNQQPDDQADTINSV